MKRILMISKDFASGGGVVNVVSMLMKFMSKDLECRHFRIGIKNDNSHKFNKLCYPLIDFARLVTFCYKTKYEIVCLNSGFETKILLRDILYLFAVKVVGIKNVILFIHGWDIRLSDFVIKNSILRFLARTVLDKVEKIIVLDNKFKKYLELIGIVSDKVFVMTTMFDSETFADINPDTLYEKPTRLLFLSRFDPLKGGYETLQALNILKNQYPNLQLIMAGDGPDYKRLKNYSLKFDLDDKVTFAGYVKGKDKSKIFSNSSIFVFPTNYREGCPVSMLEAMAAGLSIIASPVGAIPSIIKDGENGIILKDTKPETIASAIDKLITHPALLKQMQSTNRKIAFEKYEASLVANKFERLIKSINT